MDIFVLVALIGSMGFSIVVLSCICHIIGLKKDILIPSSIYTASPLVGIALSPLFRLSQIDEFILAFSVVVTILLIIFPLRGISYQFSLPKVDILEKLRGSMTLTVDEPYIVNPRFHSLITAEGIKIMVGSSYKDKFREVHIIGGYRLKQLNQVSKKVLQALKPIDDIQAQRKSNKAIMLIGLVCLSIYIIARVAGLVPRI
jgi:hypothetical protein